MAGTDEAIEKIKAMITSGELSPGDRLPPEKELSERLGLSRSSMREAVKALEVIRVLDVRRGDGTYVTSLEPRLLLEAMSFVVDLHDDSSILEIFAVRRILEPVATGMAAQLIDSEALTLLRAEIAAVDAHTEVDYAFERVPKAEVEDLVRHDLEFHRGIVEASGNAYLASLIESLSSHTVRARVWRGLTQGGSVERTLAEHTAILDAIESGDAELAAALATVHISGVEKWLRDASRLP